ARMVALADALRAYAPPNKAVTIDWPDAVRVDGGLVGGGRLGWPKSTREDDTPPWLVFGAMIRTVALTEKEAGVHPLSSALQEEGFGDTGAVEVTESFARHLMLAFDRWQVDGFASLAALYLGLIARQPAAVSSACSPGGGRRWCRLSTPRRRIAARWWSISPNSWSKNPARRILRPRVPRRRKKSPSWNRCARTPSLA